MYLSLCMLGWGVICALLPLKGNERKRKRERENEETDLHNTGSADFHSEIITVIELETK